MNFYPTCPDCGGKTVAPGQDPPPLNHRVCVCRPSPERLTIRTYAERALLTRVYGTPGLRDVRSLAYACMGLGGEMGKLLDCLKKVDRDDGTAVKPARRARAKHLLGGLYWYWTAVCYELGLEPEDVARSNLEMLEDRRERGVIHGDGWQR